jgi:ribosomal protein S1
VLVKVLEIKPERKRIALSMRQVPMERQIAWSMEKVDFGEEKPTDETPAAAETHAIEPIAEIEIVELAEPVELAELVELVEPVELAEKVELTEQPTAEAEPGHQVLPADKLSDTAAEATLAETPLA